MLLPKIEAAVESLEGVDGVFAGDRLQALGLPDPAVSDQAPDLVLSSKDGYEFGRADTGAAVVDLCDPDGTNRRTVLGVLGEVAHGRERLSARQAMDRGDDLYVTHLGLSFMRPRHDVTLPDTAIPRDHLLRTELTRA